MYDPTEPGHIPVYNLHNIPVPPPPPPSSLPISFWGRLWSGITGQSLCTNAPMRNALSPLFTEMLQKIWVMMTL